MGIPAFFRWFSGRFPLAIVNAGDMPTGIDIDNLYLDMNGIIHPCFHPENMEAPKSYDEVFESIFMYINALFYIVKPRELLYLAIDGVAPRAKMNQQRARRFKSARDAAESAGPEIAATSGEGNESCELDSNVITPGTEFMALLSSALSYYIHSRMNAHPEWKRIKVILSDSSVPGEGEHKIISYIRLQRNLPGYNPNTRHCLYGLDADLIMLGLATHEIHFSILREIIEKQKAPQQKEAYRPCLKINSTIRLKFQFLQTWVLREYLGHVMKIPDRKVNVDLDRLIDDFIFMCFFVGNDFLPQLPSMKIYEGAIDMMMEIYKQEFVRMGGYLTNGCEVNLHRVQHFVRALADHEDTIMGRVEQMEKSNDQRRELDSKSTGKAIKAIETDQYDKRSRKEIYYAKKFGVESAEDREKTRKDVVSKYIEGICWVMQYYYGGVSSWQWFYPYHYAPFASDLHDIENLEIQFTLGKPFKPFDQLMAVLPAASGHALPLAYRQLMTDPLSPLLPFYPEDFEQDMDGKRYSWQAICKLPFIDESILLPEIAKVEHTLTDEERQRNSLGLDNLFVYISKPLGAEIVSFYNQHLDDLKLSKSNIELPINPQLSRGMNGYVVISDKDVLPSEIDSPVKGMNRIEDNQTLSVFYKHPHSHPHISKPLEGVLFPPKIIRKKHILPTPRLWHEQTSAAGYLHTNRPVPGSISGRCLGKLACRLVLAYIQRPQESKLSLVQQEGHNGDALVDGTSKKRKKKSTGFVEKHGKRKKLKIDGESESKARVGAGEGVCDETVNPTKAKKRKKKSIAEKEEEEVILKNGRSNEERKPAVSERRRAAREKRLASLENHQPLESNTPSQIPETQTREKKKSPKNIETLDNGAVIIAPNGTSLATNNVVGESETKTRVRRKDKGTVIAPTKENIEKSVRKSESKKRVSREEQRSALDKASLASSSIFEEFESETLVGQGSADVSHDKRNGTESKGDDETVEPIKAKKRKKEVVSDKEEAVAPKRKRVKVTSTEKEQAPENNQLLESAIPSRIPAAHAENNQHLDSSASPSQTLMAPKRKKAKVKTKAERSSTPERSQPLESAIPSQTPKRKTVKETLAAEKEQAPENGQLLESDIPSQISEAHVENNQHLDSSAIPSQTPMAPKRKKAKATATERKSQPLESAIPSQTPEAQKAETEEALETNQPLESVAPKRKKTKTKATAAPEESQPLEESQAPEVQMDENQEAPEESQPLKSSAIPSQTPIAPKSKKKKSKATAAPEESQTPEVQKHEKQEALEESQPIDSSVIPSQIPIAPKRKKTKSKAMAAPEESQVPEVQTNEKPEAPEESQPLDSSAIPSQTPVAPKRRKTKSKAMATPEESQTPEVQKNEKQEAPEESQPLDSSAIPSQTPIAPKRKKTKSPEESQTTEIQKNEKKEEESQPLDSVIQSQTPKALRRKKVEGPENIQALEPSVLV